MKFGKTETEIFYEDMSTSRKIVQQILNFGVNQHQILMIINLLSLELEDRDTLVKISEIVKKVLPDPAEIRSSEAAEKSSKIEIKKENKKLIT